MLSLRVLIAALLFAWFASPAALRAAQENMPPDEDTTRQKIELLIKNWQNDKKRATLGLIQEAIGLSISYGAPTWNLGDHKACSQFYTKTAKSLCDAFAEDKSATDAARTTLGDLKLALERAAISGNFDRSAWSMRYAFDKNHMACEMQAMHVQSLLHLGDQYFKLSQFTEAQDALQSAVQSLADLEGQPLEDIPVECRYAPLALCNTFFAQKKYAEAENAIMLGLKYMPQWPTVKADLRSNHHDPEEYEQMLQDLEDKAKAQPEDATVQFLLGYEYYFTGKKKASKEQFERVLKIAPKHEGAALFMQSMPGEPPAAQPEALKLPGSI